MRRMAAVLALVLACCSPSGGQQQAAQGNGLAPALDLETAAIERGLVRDPRDTEVAGLYARDTDRLCVVEDDVGYRVGAFVDYGAGITCSGSGRLTRVANRLHVDFGEQTGCSFDARFEGDRIVFPGQVPDGCAALCTGRASFAGMDMTLLSESRAEAAALRDSRGKLMCPGG